MEIAMLSKSNIDPDAVQPGGREYKGKSQFYISSTLSLSISVTCHM